MIARIIIDEVGPLKNLELALGNANLIIGMNESGKTTLADILSSKLAFSITKKQKLSAFHRVTGLSPQRFGGAWKFRIDGDMDSLPEDSSYPDAIVDILSLLVIRANRNEISNKDSADVSSLGFWKTTVRNMLIGSSRISKKIEAIKKYTKTGIKIWKIRDLLDAYHGLLQEKKQELDAFRKDIASSTDDTERLKIIDARLESAKKGRDAREYKKRLGLYSKYTELVSAIYRLEQETKGSDELGLSKMAASWKEAEARLKELEKAAGELRVELEKKTEALRGTESCMASNVERAEEIRRLIGEKRERKDAGAANPEDRGKIEAEKKALMHERKKPPLIPLLLAVLGLILLALTFIWFPMLIAGSALFMIGLALFLVMMRKKYSSCKGRIEELDKALWEIDTRLEAGKLLQASESDRITQYESELAKIEAAIKRDADSSGAHRTSIESLGLKEPAVKAEIDALNARIRGFESEYGDRTALGRIIEESRSRLGRLAACKEELSDVERDIRESFGVKDIVPADLLARLELEKRSVSEEDSPLALDPKKYDTLREERESIINRGHSSDKEFERMKVSVVKELESSLAKARQASALDTIEFYNIFFKGLLDGLSVDSVYDLDSAIERSAVTRAKIDRLREYSGFLFDTVSELESRQESLIRSVLGDPGFSRNLALLLGHDRVDVSIEDETVRLLFGEKGFGLEDLSTGAVHQVNLALRFSLIKRIFAGPSTLILDDAFLHFDCERRKRACEILLEDFVDKGWQFVYTAIDDGSIERIFRSVFEDKMLNIVRIGSIDTRDLPVKS